MSVTARAITGTKTSAYAGKPNEVIPCDATGGAFSIALPLPINGVGLAAITVGPKLDATANAVTITTPAGTIIGTASLTSQYDIVTYISNGTDWIATTHSGAGGSSGITIKDEGSTLSTAATTLDFVGANVTASGTGATKTITVSGGGSAVYGPPAGWVGAEQLASFIAMPTNRCYMYRCRGGGTITGITMRIGTSSGNISAGVVGSAGGVSNPSTRRATSGAIACPAAGYAVVTIPSTVVDPSDYLALTNDDGVATFAAGPTGAITENFSVPYIGSGQMLLAGGSHPIPSTVTVAGTLTGGGHILSGA